MDNTQLAAVNSGINTEKVAQIETNKNSILTKQDALTTTQLEAVNSGANTTNISQIAANTNAIATKQDILTDANAGTNISITEEGGVKKINSTGGSGLVDDVKVNGESVVENKIANIQLKTINGNSITGQGDIEIPGGNVDGMTINGVVQQITNKKITTSLKSINNDSILGAGNISLNTVDGVDYLPLEDEGNSPKAYILKDNNKLYIQKKNEVWAILCLTDAAISQGYSLTKTQLIDEMSIHYDLDGVIKTQWLTPSFSKSDLFKIYDSQVDSGKTQILYYYDGATPITQDNYNVYQPTVLGGADRNKIIYNEFLNKNDLTQNTFYQHRITISHSTTPDNCRFEIINFPINNQATPYTIDNIFDFVNFYIVGKFKNGSTPYPATYYRKIDNSTINVLSAQQFVNDDDNKTAKIENKLEDENEIASQIFYLNELTLTDVVIPVTFQSLVNINIPEHNFLKVAIWDVFSQPATAILGTISDIYECYIYNNNLLKLNCYVNSIVSQANGGFKTILEIKDTFDVIVDNKRITFKTDLAAGTTGYKIRNLATMWKSNAYINTITEISASAKTILMFFTNDMLSSTGGINLLFELPVRIINEEIIS